MAITLSRTASFLFVAWIALANSVAAQTLTATGEFNSAVTGSNPYLSTLVLGPDGNYYGMATSGGAESGGAIFQVTPAGAVKIVYSFCFQAQCVDGQSPKAGLILGSDGYLYGTTSEGGAYSRGVVFRFNLQNSQLAVLWNFCKAGGACVDGAAPVGNLIEGSPGVYYGTTSGGGNASGAGTVFSITSAGGNLQTLYSFCATAGCPDGNLPYSGLVQVPSGSGIFYGVTYSGGKNSAGTVYSITSGGAFSDIYNFCSETVACADGSYPIGALAPDPNGYLYGTTNSGGFYGYGTIFRIATNGRIESLYNFCAATACADGGSPWSQLTLGSDGNFYGTTPQYGAGNRGTIYKITPNGEFSSLYSFCAPSTSLCAGGSYPYGGLVQSASGNFYGVTFTGGDSNNDGVVYQFSLGPPALAAKGGQVDYFRTGQSDLTVWRASTGEWYSINASAAPSLSLAVQWGQSGDIPVIGDYDGDGKTDVAIWRPSTGTWYVRQSSDGQTLSASWGMEGDIVVPGDYDGDGHTDFAVFRPSNGTWYIKLSNGGQTTGVQWGASGDIPVPGDYDGDGKTDLAVFRPSNGVWYITRSSDNQIVTKQWAATGDIPVAGDYDGDGQTDFAVWRPSNGTWYVIQSSNGEVLSRQWGQSGDVPVPRDYDGDGKTDISVWRPSQGTWYLNLSNAFEDNPQIIGKQWGLSTDTPVNKPVGQ